MGAPPPPDSLMNDLTGLAAKIVREAYSAGYLRGAEDMTQRIVAAARGDAVAVGEAKAVALPPVRTRTRAEPVSTPGIHPNSAEARRFPYGAISNAFREALRQTPPWGLTQAELVKRVSEILQADVSGMDHRDTIKRLKRSEELFVQNGRYFAGPKLTGVKPTNPKKDEAPSGDDAGASLWGSLTG